MIQASLGGQFASQAALAEGIANASVPELVAQVVAQFPGRIAAVDESAALTYSELAAAADKVAHALVDSGVRPGDLVALGLSRSVGYLAAMLGVLRAGAVYLPVDPAGPARRTRAALTGLGAAMMLTDGTVSRDLGLPTLLIGDHAAAAGPDAPAERSDVQATGGERPCCVLLTSGSTGPPKAVLIPHRGVTTLAWRPWFAPLGPGAVVLALAPMHFDAATFEVWGALCNGATVVVAPRSLLGAEELRALIDRHGVNVLHLTAGLFRVLADERPDCFAGLRCLLTGGDVISAKHVRAVLDRFPGLRLVGCYGPTEGTTFTSVTVVTRPPAGAVPLGEPLPGRHMEILDETLRPAQADTPGELYLGGAGLALGYLGRTDETAARFIPDPRPGWPGRRLYRTGDLARRCHDGTVEFLGRVDDQVKIRGVRVEPAEVEQALVEYPGIRDAVVRARGPAGDAILAAFLTAEPGCHPSDHALRQFLSSRLPAAMIPSVFAPVERFPMTIQGKVDVAVLDRIPLTAVTDPEAAAPSPEKLTDLVRGTWRDCLQRELGPDDNVFELGGHSLVALRVAARLERALARRVPLREVIDHPTIRTLAGWLGDSGGAPAASGPGAVAGLSMDTARFAGDVTAASDDEVATVLRLLATGEGSAGRPAHDGPHEPEQQEGRPA